MNPGIPANDGDVPTILGGVESIHLNEAGRNFQHEIVDDGSLGPMEEIVTAIIDGGRTRKT